ncbi:MAG: Na/Pi cotransporter family protein [Aureispira sp.]|nr:Na/Pi cotransporter family protein [Aureispira sp.]
MLEGFDIWKLLAGLGIFLFGMFLMEESIKKLSGRAFKKLIRKYTTGRIKSIFSGMFVTTILQSSSAVSLMLLAFVGAGIMAMENAIGVILGSNIGTTITSWIVALVGFKLKIESFALPLIGSGGLGLIFLGKSERYSNFSKLLVGFGFLFMGLDYMKTSVEVFAESFDLSTVPDYGLWLYLGIGILLTAIMQSSSATIAIVLTTLNAEMIEFDSAAAMVIGSNIGTTITILLGAIGAVQIKKRVAYSHFIFNLTTGLIALALMPYLIRFIFETLEINDNYIVGIALFHTIFNIIGVLVFLPFTSIFAKLLIKFVPDQQAILTQYITNATTDIAEAGITAIQKETLHLAKEVLRYNLKVLNIDKKLVFSLAPSPHTKRTPKNISTEERYINLKLLQSEIVTFSAGIQYNELADEESIALSRYLHGARMALHSAKTLRDIKEDFDDFENADHLFFNQQYALFKTRLIDTYMSIDRLIETPINAQNRVETILEIMNCLRKDDKNFVATTTQAISSKLLRNIDVSTALIVNRALVQSSRQILLAIKELLLTDEESAQFDQAQEVNN